jgi:hypothetical protein
VHRWQDREKALASPKEREFCASLPESYMITIIRTPIFSLGVRVIKLKSLVFLSQFEFSPFTLSETGKKYTPLLMTGKVAIITAALE